MDIFPLDFAVLCSVPLSPIIKKQNRTNDTLTGTKINGLKTFSLDGENDKNFSEKCRHPQFQVFNTYAKSNYLFIVMMY